MLRRRAHADTAGETALPVAEPPASLAYRLQALTGVRILAAGIVFLSHTGPPAGSPPWFERFVVSGYMGVTLFFVLSGFVLTLNYFDELSRPTPAKVWRYAVARLARVYPLYLLVLAFAVVDSMVRGAGNAHWLQHALALQAWDPDINVVNGFNGPAWSISVEVFLYATLPVFAVLLARVRSTRALLVAGALVIAVMVGIAWWFAVDRAGLPLDDPRGAHRWLYRNPAGRVGDFLLGILAARIYLNVRRSRPDGVSWGGWAAGGAGLTILVAMTVAAVYVTSFSWDVLYAVPAVIMILGLALTPAGLFARLLSRPTMVLLGEASYAFYLIHMLVLVKMDGFMWTKVVTPAVVVYELMLFGFTLAAAVGLHVLVEKPARARIRRVLGGVRRDGAVAGAPVERAGGPEGSTVAAPAEPAAADGRA
jgi:peptidoglycan/LPS O-acetylase OafA/YrhL